MLTPQENGAALLGILTAGNDYSPHNLKAHICATKYILSRQSNAMYYSICVILRDNERLNEIKICKLI